MYWRIDTELNLTYPAGLVLGIAFLVTWAISVGAIVQPIHVTFGLIVLNWVLIVDALAVVIIGTTIWFYTLQERANFHVVYSALSNQTRVQIQDKVYSLICWCRLKVWLRYYTSCNAAVTSTLATWSKLVVSVRTRHSSTRLSTRQKLFALALSPVSRTWPWTTFSGEHDLRTLL